MTIKQKQCLLSYLGYYVGNIDGIWGTLSKTATKAFQKDFGLPDDGICGADTEKAMKHAVACGMPAREPVGKVESEDFPDDVEYFDEPEFDCKCGRKYCNGRPARIKPAVVRIAESARKHFGRPCYVVSGLRCKEWNRIQGGVENSQHMYGEACDLQIQGVSADALLAYIQKQPGVRYAYKINATNVHFDIPAGKR